jgi:hypothetical protein
LRRREGSALFSVERGHSLRELGVAVALARVRDYDGEEFEPRTVRH